MVNDRARVSVGMDVAALRAAKVLVGAGVGAARALVAATMGVTAGETAITTDAASLATPRALYARTAIVCVPGDAFQFCVMSKRACGLGAGAVLTIAPSTSTSTRAIPAASPDADYTTTLSPSRNSLPCGGAARRMLGLALAGGVGVGMHAGARMLSASSNRMSKQIVRFISSSFHNLPNLAKVRPERSEAESKGTFARLGGRGDGPVPPTDPTFRSQYSYCNDCR